jgi:8-oxo-dGTP pyrophosphatase MutT (NUDIX family)
VVVDPATRQVLLLFHAKVQRWLQPGGHADGDGHLAASRCARPRRRRASTGCAVLTPAVDLDVHVFHHAAGVEPDHLHLDVRYLVVAPPDAVVRGNDESEALRWVGPDELTALDVDAGTVRMVRAAFAAWDELAG